MAGGKQTPRQRMMGILYLVLLGLIALEVPDSLLDSFKNISDSLTASKANVQTGIETTFKAFEASKLKTDKVRAQPIYDRAKTAQQLADDLNAYVETIKTKMKDASGGYDESINDYKGRGDLDVSVRLMINEDKYAIDLHKKIDHTKAALLALLNPKERGGVVLSLNTTPPPPKNGFPTKDWEEANFGEGIPMAASMTALTKIQSDTKNAENEVVKKILGEVDQAQVTLDQFRAVAVPNSNYVIAGQPYKADIYLSAYDSHSSPTITVDGSSVHTENGVGTYTTIASGDGLKTWTGTLLVKQVDGPAKPYPISGSYMVAKPSAVVSPDKMNVLYIGVPNPVTVSAPGVATSSLKLNISGGSLSGGTGGHYTADVKTLGTAKITVTGDKGLVLGTSEFRVKRIPDPKPEFAGKSGGNTSAANIRAQDKVFAKLDNFDFDAKFSVTRFTLLIAKPRQDAIILSTTGSELSAAMRSAMNTVSSGTTIVFKDIVAVGPDGSQRGLDPIVISAN
ncbi:type IX secretion system motor protein PorM/GldM [Mucilaginibacter sp.]